MEANRLPSALPPKIRPRLMCWGRDQFGTGRAMLKLFQSLRCAAYLCLSDGITKLLQIQVTFFDDRVRKLARIFGFSRFLSLHDNVPLFDRLYCGRSTLSVQ
jgi:hypothetical protein